MVLLLFSLSLNWSRKFHIRFPFLVFLSLCYIPEILGGLFQISLLKIPIMFPLCTSEGMGGFSFIEEPNILFSIFVPIMIYNADKDKSQILTDLKGKAGIYLWIHKESGKRYIGSAFDLSKRLKDYYSTFYLKRTNNYICNAIIYHTHSAFYLSILEYIDIPTNLTKEEARKLILESEQFYLDYIFSLDDSNIYNILPTAGSSLGHNLSEKTKALMSVAKSGENHPMFGKTLSPEFKAKLSEAKSGENHHMFGKSHTPESLAKISQAMLGENNPMYGIIGENSPMFGKKHSAETLVKMSEAKSGDNHPFFGKNHSAESLTLMSLAKNKMVFVYSFNLETKVTKLFKEFSSCSDAALYFDCTTRSISNYLDKDKLFRKKWILSSTMKEDSKE